MIATGQDILFALGKIAGSAEEVALAAWLAPFVDRVIKDELRSEVELATYTELLPDRQRYKERDAFVDYDRVGQRVLEFRGRGEQLSVLQVKTVPLRKVLEVRESWYPGAGGFAGQAELFSDATILDPGAYFADFQEPVDLVTGLGLSESGWLVKPWMTWSTFPRSVKVTYQAGWTADELASGRACALKYACALTGAKTFRAVQVLHDQQGGFAGIGGISSEGLDGMTFGYEAGSIQALVGQQMRITPEVMQTLERYRNYRDALG